MSRGERPVVPRAEPRSYYGQPIVKQPVWTWEIPTYFFTGGLAGASAGLAHGAQRTGNPALARRAWALAAAGTLVSPALLVSDLGRPERFLNMLRVVKPTSPMSVGSWLLSGFGAATAVASADALLPRSLVRRLPGGGRELGAAAAVAAPAAAALGLPLCTYTAALVSTTSVPVWHEARRELPLVFAGGALASAGAAAAMLTPSRHAAPARRLAGIGAALELTAAEAMERRLGALGEPYRSGRAGRLARVARALTAVGGLVVSARGRHAAGARAGAALLLAGGLCMRWSIYRAGFQSAADPRYTVAPQRARLNNAGDRR